MDTSNLAKDYPSYNASKKKVHRYFTNETDGHIMLEFVALRAKSYVYIFEGEKKIKAKGIRGNVVKII